MVLRQKFVHAGGRDEAVASADEKRIVEQSPKRLHLARGRRDAYVQLLGGERDGTRFPNGKKKPDLLGRDVFAVHDGVALENGAPEKDGVGALPSAYQQILRVGRADAASFPRKDGRNRRPPTAHTKSQDGSSRLIDSVSFCATSS